VFDWDWAPGSPDAELVEVVAAAVAAGSVDQKIPADFGHAAGSPVAIADCCVCC